MNTPSFVKVGSSVDIINPKTKLRSVRGSVTTITESGAIVRISGPFGSGNRFCAWDELTPYGTTHDDHADWKTPIRMKSL